MGDKPIENFRINDIKRIKNWGKLIGTFMIIYGVIAGFQGFFTTGIGAIPGVIAIMLGMCLRETGEQAKNILRSKGQSKNAVNILLQRMSFILVILGILMGAILLLTTLFFIFVWVYD